MIVQLRELSSCRAMTAALPLSDPKSRAPITHDTLLVVEGRDAFGFFLGLLTELQLDQRIEIRNCGGVTDLPDFLLALGAVSGFGAVKSLGVVQDSENDAARAFLGVCNALRGGNLPVPVAPLHPTVTPPVPRVAVTLLPDPNTPGMLESLCWQALAGDQRMPCIDEYLDCIAKRTGQAVQRPEKSRVHAYIAAREEPWFLLGQAARAGYFPWTSAAFNPLKLFLQGLIAP